VSTLIELNREKHVQTIMRWADHYAGLVADSRQADIEADPAWPYKSELSPKEAVDKVESVKRFLEHTIRELLKAHYEAARPPVL
jgi:hypothetical protein